MVNKEMILLTSYAIKGAKSYNLIFDFNTNEDKIILLIKIIKIDISKWTGRTIIRKWKWNSFTYNDIHTNKTTITISTANNNHHSTIFIKLEGILSYMIFLDI